MGVFDAIGAGVGAVTNIVTGQLDAAQDRQAMRFNADLQRDFAKNGIQWRVDDAKKAGLHPLAALGMSPASAFAIPIGSNGYDGAGQNLSRAISAAGTHDDRELERAQLELLNANIKKTYTETAAIASDMGLKGQQSGQAIPPLGPQREYPELPTGQLPNPPHDYTSGYIDVKAPPIMSAKSGDSSMQAGTIPGKSMLQLHPRMNMIVPAGEGQEATWEMWAELPWYEKIAFIVENMNRFGPGWGKDYMRVRGGMEPEGTYLKPEPRPDGMTSSLVQPGVRDAIDRAIGKLGPYKQRYKRFNRENYERSQKNYRDSHGGR